MHQWWGDNVTYHTYNETFYKEGQATTAEYYYAARAAAVAAGGIGTTAGDAAYEASLVSRFNSTSNYGSTGTYWTIAPSNPTSATLFGNSNTYSRPGTSYLALRAILGKTLFNAAEAHIQSAYGGGSISETQLKNEFHKYFAMDNVPACRAKLDEFFKRVVGHGVSVRRRRATSRGSPARAWPAAASMTPTAAAPIPSIGVGDVERHRAGDAGADARHAGRVRRVHAGRREGLHGRDDRDRDLLGRRRDAVASPTRRTTAPGHLVNGAFSLPTALKAAAPRRPARAPARAGQRLAADAGELASPISNDLVGGRRSRRRSAPTDALRTGAYSKTLTFTLSTTTP